VKECFSFEFEVWERFSSFWDDSKLSIEAFSLNNSVIFSESIWLNLILYFSVPFELISKSEFSIDNYWKEIGSKKAKYDGVDLVFNFILLDSKIDCEINV
jgi:hypothetical protein